MGCCRPNVFYISLAVVGIILVVIGTVLVFELPVVMHNSVSKKMPLKPGTQVYNSWVEPPVPVYMQFWVWDLVNRDDYVDKGAKPILREKGPYTYREYRPKTKIEFSKNGSMVSYRQPKTYVFMRNMSVGSETDTFMTINFPILSVATMARFKIPHWIDRILSPFLQALGERLFKEFTVKDYLWGYKEPLIKKINDFTRKYFHVTLIKNETFGLFSGPTGNGTDDGLYMINTGKYNLNDYLSINTWNGNKSVPYWSTPYCNQINGSDGTGWNPFIQKNETLYIFSSEVCRSLYVSYVDDVTIKGIPMYRFTPPPVVFADSATNPDNAGYCTPDCLGSGVLNISQCREGAPVVISQPHFYQGAKRYIDAFEGIQPNAEQHATVLDIEPLTGAALNAAKKLQLNFYVRPFPFIQDTKKMVNDTIFPVVWLNESGLITDEVARGFRQQVTLLVKMSKVLPWVLIGVGLAVLIIATFMLLHIYCWDKDDTRPPETESTAHKRPDGEEEEEQDESNSRTPLLSSSEPQTNYSTTVDT